MKVKKNLKKKSTRKTKPKNQKNPNKKKKTTAPAYRESTYELLPFPPKITYRDSLKVLNAF